MHKRNGRHKRVVVISDLHCGHVVGLTPPAWQQNDTQAELYDFYVRKMKAMRPVNALLVNGDCIDGRGDRSGSVELITTDRLVQCEMAVEAIEVAECKNVGIIKGTPYHTGTKEDFENVIAQNVNAKACKDHAWFNIEGVCFDAKHAISSSSVPYGRHTATAREKIWNDEWSKHGASPKADVIIRSHVHYHQFCGGPDGAGEKIWLGMTTPALQGQGSRFGSRLCSGTVHFGFVWFDVYDGKLEDWGPVLAPLAIQKQEAINL